MPGKKLTRKQKKLDANKNKKIDAEDFKILRGRKKKAAVRKKTVRKKKK